MRYELADYEWSAIKPMLPNKPRGVPRVNDRRVLNGIFWVLRFGAPWRDLPEAFRPYTTCYNRFVRWRRAGVCPKGLPQADMAYLIVPSGHEDLVNRFDASAIGPLAEPSSSLRKLQSKNSTAPVSRLYIAPVILTPPFASISASTGLSFRISATVISTFFRATASTKA
jgi:Putative transposase of IS4/5 family (DUF4096)